jgi:hypothetical protein
MVMMMMMMMMMIMMIMMMMTSVQAHHHHGFSSLIRTHLSGPARRRPMDAGTGTRGDRSPGVQGMVVVVVVMMMMMMMILGELSRYIPSRIHSFYSHPSIRAVDGRAGAGADRSPITISRSAYIISCHSHQHHHHRSHRFEIFSVVSAPQAYIMQLGYKGDWESAMRVLRLRAHPDVSAV